MDNVSKQELKQVWQLLLIILPCFLALYIGFHFTPMYREAQAANRQAIITYLTVNYYHRPSAETRAVIIQTYKVSDNEVNPQKLLTKFSETHYNQFLGAIR